jgi:hypothetical protein
MIRVFTKEKLYVVSSTGGQHVLTGKEVTGILKKRKREVS